MKQHSDISSDSEKGQSNGTTTKRKERKPHQSGLASKQGPYLPCSTHREESTNGSRIDCSGSAGQRDPWKERPMKRICTAHRTDGQPCQASAIRGGTVCRSHGGSASQVKDAARWRLLELVDPALVRLDQMIRDSTDERLVLAAVKEILSRTGIEPPIPIAEITDELLESEIARLEPQPSSIGTAYTSGSNLSRRFRICSTRWRWPPRMFEQSGRGDCFTILEPMLRGATKCHRMQQNSR